MEPIINTINNNNYPTPYMSAPSSPQRPHNFFFFSAPTSPLHISCSPSSSIITFDEYQEEEEGYEFEFSGQLDTISRSSLSTTDELFDGGKIRPLKPQINGLETSNTPEEEIPPKFNDQSRGRSKNIPPSRSNSQKGISRSLSPLRVSEQEQQNVKSFNWGSKKWRIKDFLQFRSASEGRVNSSRGKYTLRKYFSLVSSKRNDEESKSYGSFRSVGLCSSSMVDGSVSRRQGQGHVSGHEMAYMENRGVSSELLKKKTSLPYKHGLLGCLGLNPSMGSLLLE